LSPFLCAWCAVVRVVWLWFRRLMMVCGTLLLLFCVFCVPGVLCVLEIFNPTFKDPFSGSQAILDINIQTPSRCIPSMTVNVTIPTTASSEEGNAIYQGPAFGYRPIVGTSTHSLNPVTVSVAWNGVDTLSFRGFIFPDDVSDAGLPSGLFNLNYDIPDSEFVGPANDNYNNGACVATQTCNVPLSLVYDTGFIPNSIADYLRINLNNPQHFKVTTSSDDINCASNPPCGPNTPGGCGDPEFSGFQGQVFQFHGLPDEHFNLVSSPDVQLNSHFVYLSSGKCDYNDTECFTHPGTYMDVLGFSLGEIHVKLVAGPHEQGLHLWVNDAEIPRGSRVRVPCGNSTASLHYHHNGRVDIHTPIMNFQIANSDMFFNLHVALNDVQLMRVGSIKHTVTDHAVCRSNSETNNHQLVEHTVAKKYPVTSSLHGLIGQTWRNVKVCNRDWMGTVQDYLVSDLFASDYHYNYFNY
jgi:hypothetical protein